MTAAQYATGQVGNKDYTKATVVIIGAGFSGLCIAIDLIRNNIHNFVVLEKSAGLGGTWRDNKYPGCCCDVNSHLYSYSFEQNPDWTRMYPDQEEILAYIGHVAAKFNLHKYIRLSSEVQEARWSDSDKKWTTKVKVIGSKDAEFGDEYSITSDFLVSGMGQLNYPNYPSIPGIDTFQGKMMHSARWDWSYDFTGKKIGIIGNGATAVQIVPEVAKAASHLTVFQRTANWVIPRMDISIWKPFRAMLRYCPPALWKIRAVSMDVREYLHAPVADPASSVATQFKEQSVNYMHKDLAHRPDLWEKLTPDYPPFCKRILISDDYFKALGRDNVTLETGRIDSISEKGVIVDGVEQEFDFIILATGFRSVDFMYPVKVYGRNGRSLSDIWAGGARALYGVAVEDLPNFGMLYGPNTNLGHNSIILMIESQTKYVVEQIKKVIRARQRGQTLAITPKSEKIEEFNSALQKELSHTAFASPNCSSWYKTAEGLITNNWSGTVVDYQKLLSKLDWNDYEFEGSAADELRSSRAAQLGRVHEESFMGLKALGFTTVSALAIGAALALKAPRLLRW